MNSVRIPRAESRHKTSDTRPESQVPSLKSDKCPKLCALCSMPLICAIFMFFLIVDGSVIVSRAEEPATAIGIRTLGMGGASVAAVNDEDLFFSNPAALSQIENSVFSSFDLRTGFSQDAVALLSRLSRYSNDSNLSDLTEAKVRNLNVLDELYKLSGPLNVTYIRRYFGFGLFETVDLKFDSKYYGSAGRAEGFGPSSVRVSAQPTTFGMVSFASATTLPPRPSRVSIGGTLKYIVRSEVDWQDIDEMADHGVTADIGRGIGFDIGALYAIRNTLTLGLMLRDALSSQFVWKDQIVKWDLEKKKPVRKTEMKPCAAVGISFTPGWELLYVLQDFIFALDMDRMRYPEIGAEVAVYRFLKLRAGVSDDGVAFGFGFKLDMFAFDYAFTSGFEDKYAGDINSPSHFLGLAMRL